MIDIDPRRWRRIDALLAQALDRDEEERGAWLRVACGGDDRLHDELRTLLDGADEAARAIGESAAGFAAPLLAVEEASDDLGPGDRVGPYEIEEELGRGGMGVVYRAARADGAFEKSVALKLVKRGMDTREVLERFRRERQVLAGLDHPGIARLLDGGAAPDGRPYLVMEYVEGEPITEYCDRRGLGVEARLALFERVCEAVQHAHRRLVVHRDLKPANVLIAEGEDGRPRPKLLDFGIAGLLEPDRDGVRTIAPRLTPAYAAPEQARGEVVTTAADVWALGVMLYELLAGRRPDRPPRPPSEAAAPGAAASRRTTPARLLRRCRGDLDTIVAKALREDPGERYLSVESLRDDLRRHGSGLPIHARPASVGYRLRKFLRRHRTGTAVTAGWAALLIVGALLYARGIEHEKRLAQEEARRAQGMADVMRDLFETADPYTLGAGRVDSLLLVRGRRAVEHDLAGEPDLQVQLLTTLGRVYRERGEYGQAQVLLGQALAIGRRTHDAPSESVIEVLRELGGLHTDRSEHAEAGRHYREMVAMQRALHGEDDPVTVIGLGLLAQVEGWAGRMDESERMHREIVDRSRGIHPPTDPAHVNAVWKLARVLYVRGKFAESEAAFREVLALRRERFGEEHPEVAQALHWLGLVLTDRGEYEASEAHLRRALDMRRRLLGPDHGEVAVSLFGLGLLASERGDFEEATAHVGRSVEMSRRVLGDGHRDTAFRIQVLGELHGHAGEAERALALLDEALAIYRRTLGEGHAGTRGALASRGRALSDAGSYAAAEAAFREALSIGGEGDPPRGRAYHEARAGYGELLVRTGRATVAEPLIREAVTALEARTAARHDRSVLYAKAALGACLAAQGRRAEARTILEEVLAVTGEHYGPENPRTVRARRALLDLEV